MALDMHARVLWKMVWCPGARAELVEYKRLPLLSMSTAVLVTKPRQQAS